MYENIHKYGYNIRLTFLWFNPKSQVNALTGPVIELL